MSHLKHKTTVDITPSATNFVTEPKELTEFDSAEARTVFSDPANFNIKHPLHCGWTFWFDNPSRKKTFNSWSQNLKKLITVSTVEDFWGVYNNIAKPSEISAGSNFHLFRDGIKPEWEDPANEHGGKWVFIANKGKHDVDGLWLFTLLACVGEAFDVEDELCGAIFSSRKDVYRITLWTRSCDNEEVALSIGRKFKDTLSPINETIEFSSHAESSKSKSKKLIV